MKPVNKLIYLKRRGSVLIISMIFILVFCALAVSMASLSGVNLQIADNQHKANSALSAAQSGLDVGKYLVNGYSKTSTIKTAGDVTQIDRDNTWNAFRTYISTHTVADANWPNPVGVAKDFASSYINFGSNGEKFQVKYHYNYDANGITLESTGIIPTSDGSITKKATVGTNIERNGDILNYAIASRGRMWLTGDSTIHGDIFSAWNLSTNQLAQLTQLQTQIQQKLDAGTLDSSSFSSLVSSLSLSSSNKTAILNQLLAGTLTPADAAARCISVMSTSGLSVAPFNMTSDSIVLGSINTCWTKAQVEPKSWQFETWDADDNPIYQTDAQGNIIYVTDSSGNFLLDDNGEKIKARVVTSDGDNIVETGEDEIQGVCAGHQLWRAATEYVRDANLRLRYDGILQ